MFVYLNVHKRGFILALDFGFGGKGEKTTDT
jgi:hypothetical protein